MTGSEPATAEFETLKLLAEIEREELSYRRKREMQIFSGTAAILLAVMGAVFLPRSADETFIVGHGQAAQMVAIAAIIFIVGLSVVWQDREWRDAIKHQKALTRIFQALGCFAKGRFGLEEESIFMEDRDKWGAKHSKFITRVGAPGKILATIALGLLAIVSILAV